MSVDGQDGEPMDVTTGLPQGSPISPALFAIYIADVECVGHRGTDSVGHRGTDYVGHRGTDSVGHQGHRRVGHQGRRRVGH